LSAQKKYADAASAYSASVKCLPDPAVSVQLAKAYYSNQQTSEAETTLKKTVAAFPDYFKARFELASLYATQRRWNEAQAQLISNRSNEPTVEAEFGNQRGLLALQMKDPANAHAEFQKAIQLQEKATYWNNLGIADQQLGQTDDAQKAYQEA